MSKRYENFREKEMSDGPYLVADPVRPTDEPLRIEIGWFDVEPGEQGEWEAIVGAIVRNDLQEELQLQQDGRGTIERERAIENLVEADTPGDVPLEDTDKAAAIIDYFIEQGAFIAENNELVVLHDPNTLADEDVDLDGNREFQILNWAAAIDACIGYMDDTLSSFEAAKERIKQHLDDVDRDDISRAAKRKREKLQELQNLGPGSTIPDPNEMSGPEQTRFQKLKEDVAYYQTMEEVSETELGAVEESINELARNIERLEVAKEEYERKISDIRTWGLKEQVFPEDAIDIADNMAETITALSGVESHQERAEDLDVTDLREMANEDLSQASEVADQVSKTVDSAERDDSAADLTLE